MRDPDHSDLCARRLLVQDLLNLARIGITRREDQFFFLLTIPK